MPGTDVIREDRSADSRSYRVDFSKIAGELGFECETGLEEGVREMARVIMEGRFPSHKDPIYSNVATLQKAEVSLFVND